MTRRLLILGASFCIALAALPERAHAQTAPLRLYIETIEVTREQGQPAPPPPLYQDNVLLLPVRLVLERLGAHVSWDDSTDSLSATLPDTKIALRLGEPTVTVNEEDLEMGSPPPLRSGVMYLPDGVWCRILPIETRFIEHEGTVELRYDWVPRVVTVTQLAEFPRFFQARTVLVEGEYRGWRAKGLQGPVTQGPPGRHRGDWIVADESGGIYVSGEEPDSLDSTQRPAPRVRVTAVPGLTEAGAPYLKASRVERL